MATSEPGATVTIVTTTLSAAEARRVFLAAQGLSRSRPTRRARDRDFAAYLSHQGVLQLDTVNVLARAHYLPFYSRLGPYSVSELDTYLWGDTHGHSAHTFEHWGHEASVMPRELLPAMHFRMVTDNNWKVSRRSHLEAERPGLIAQVRAHINQYGPLTSNQVEHLSPREGTRGTWWDTSHVKDALDLLFFTGDVASSRGKNFSRTYDATERAWGLAPASSGSWGLAAADARQQLFDRALAACGIGLPRDLADHFRLVPGSGSGGAMLGQWAQSAVERGLAEWVSVEGWGSPALLAVGGPTADAP
jgi:uncharacterized protein YcaQ